MSNRRFVFGIGTGRCGTLSLARLLNSQVDAKVTHEMRPLLDWDAPHDEQRRIARARLERLARESDAGLVGDVASFYLPYLPYLLEASEDIRVVCLRRPRHEVIASFIAWLERTESLPVNHWLERPWKRGMPQSEFHSLVWSRMFPKYADVSLEVGMQNDPCPLCLCVSSSVLTGRCMELPVRSRPIYVQRPLLPCLRPKASAFSLSRNKPTGPVYRLSAGNRLPLL